MTRFEQARQMAVTNPMLTQVEIARAIGLSREGVRLALQRDGITVRDGRGKHGNHRRGPEAKASGIADARRKVEARLPLTREERHLLWQDYRRREREGGRT